MRCKREKRRRWNKMTRRRKGWIRGGSFGTGSHMVPDSVC